MKFGEKWQKMVNTFARRGWVCLFGGATVFIRAGELVCGCRTLRGLRKLRPRVELHSLRGEAERLGNRAETKRPPGPGNEALKTRSAPAWNDETAVLQVERANRRR